MSDRGGRRGASIEVESSSVVGGIPLARMGAVQEYGRTIAWLASPVASFIQGHALMIDRGATKASL